MSHIFGIGVDLVDISRIAGMRARHGERLCGRVFLPAEWGYCLGLSKPDEGLAARFAAKEAVMKALGTGWSGGVGFMGIEVVRSDSGRPFIRLHGGALAKADEMGIGVVHLSLSHSEGLAMAQVVIERK